MRRVEKIEKYCTTHNFFLVYQNNKRMEYFGGKSFYNDGVYWVDNYSLIIGSVKYHLEVKETGRPLYRIFNNSGPNAIVVAFSQKDLICYLERNRDMYNKPLY